MWELFPFCYPPASIREEVLLTWGDINFTGRPLNSHSPATLFPRNPLSKRDKYTSPNFEKTHWSISNSGTKLNFNLSQTYSLWKYDNWCDACTIVHSKFLKMNETYNRTPTTKISCWLRNKLLLSWVSMYRIRIVRIHLRLNEEKWN